MIAVARLRRSAPDPALWEPAADISENKKLRLEAGLPKRFWQYAAFSAVTMLGFSTWAVLAFHVTSRHLMPASAVPVLYALAMAAASVAAVLFGRLYDRVGLRGLVVLPLLGALVPLLSLSSTVVLVVVGAAVWGIGTGIHDSTMRAAVADLVPAHRRGAGYGTFTAIYGLSWLAGAAIIGLLYEHGVAAAATFVGVVQLAALGLLAPLLRS
jgi:MFS family permease